MCKRTFSENLVNQNEWFNDCDVYLEDAVSLTIRGKLFLGPVFETLDLMSCFISFYSIGKCSFIYPWSPEMRIKKRVRIQLRLKRYLNIRENCCWRCITHMSTARSRERKCIQDPSSVIHYISFHLCTHTPKTRTKLTDVKTYSINKVVFQFEVLSLEKRTRNKTFKIRTNFSPNEWRNWNAS